jgi:AMP deaminase
VNLRPESEIDDVHSPEEDMREFVRNDEESDHNGDGIPSTDADPHLDGSDLHDGMLLRDLPKRTTFYDPVAERQWSHTDAKLFYQMSRFGISEKRQSSPAPDDSVDLNSSLELPEPGIPMPEPEKPSAGPQSTPSAASPYGQPAGPSRAGADAAQAWNQPPSRPRTTHSRPHPAEHGTRSPATPLADQPEAPLRPSPRPAAESWRNPGVSLPENDPHMLTELSNIATKINKVTELRRKYIELSLQRDDDNPKNSPDWVIHPPPPEPSWVQEPDKTVSSASNSLSNSMMFNSEAAQKSVAEQHGNPSGPTGKHVPLRKRKPGENVGGDFVLEDFLPVPGPCDMTFRLDDNGVYQVLVGSSVNSDPSPLVHVPTIREFYMDLDEILSISSDGPCKSFAFRRLQYLEGQFNMYALLNEYQETADSKRVPHRDFYNVRKVDTHVHHSACMNQKHLLRFIKSKMKKSPDEVVLFRDGRHLTLAEVFQSINLTAYDLSIDTLDMHVSLVSFPRLGLARLSPHSSTTMQVRLHRVLLVSEPSLLTRYATSRHTRTHSTDSTSSISSTTPLENRGSEPSS